MSLSQPGAHAAMRSELNVRVAVIPERYGSVMSPCASIRLHAFTARFKADVRYVIPDELAAFGPHVVIWNRGAVTESRDFDRLEAAKTKGARLVFDLDDNLLAMDEHPEREAYADIIGAVRRSVLLADVTWCSTPMLALAMEKEGGTVQCMPNALDDVLWQAADPTPVALPSSGPLRLLYMGTRTHDEDFRLLDSALELVWSRRPRTFSLTLVGVNATATKSRPWLDIVSPPAHVGASYPAFVHWFSQRRGYHAGVAPLVDSVFSRCKSSIKVLDYAQVGLTTLASDVPAYRHDATDDRILVENTPQEWARSVSGIIDQTLPLETVAVNASQRIGSSVFEAAVASRWSSCTQHLGD